MRGSSSSRTLAMALPLAASTVALSPTNSLTQTNSLTPCSTASVPHSLLRPLFSENDGTPALARDLLSSASSSLTAAEHTLSLNWEAHADLRMPGRDGHPGATGNLDEQESLSRAFPPLGPRHRLASLLRSLPLQPGLMPAGTDLASQGDPTTEQLQRRYASSHRSLGILPGWRFGSCISGRANQITPFGEGSPPVIPSAPSCQAVPSELFLSARLALPSGPISCHGCFAAAGALGTEGGAPGVGPKGGLGPLEPQGQPSAALHQWYKKQTEPFSGQEGGRVEQETIKKRGGHRPQEQAEEGEGESGAHSQHPDTAVVLLGWLGAKQRNLRRYAEWYNSQGMDAITFVIPLGDLISVKATENGLQHVDNLVTELEQWLYEDEEEAGQRRKNPHRHLVVHTFSNTGWLAYGAVLQRLRERHGEEGVREMIKGCVVDSAPNLTLDPEVFSAGFTAALLGKWGAAARHANRVQAEEGRRLLGGSQVAHAATLPQEEPPLHVTPRGTDLARGPDGAAKDGQAVGQTGPTAGREGWETGEKGRDQTSLSSEGQVMEDRVIERLQSLREQLHLGMITGEAGHAVSAEDVDALLIRVGEGRREAEPDVGPDGERSASVDQQHLGAVEWTMRAFLTQLFRVLLTIPHYKSTLEKLTCTLATGQPPCPQLYIYSLADSVIPARDVEHFIRLQRAAGIPVSAKRFSNSPHVDHFRTFPDAYTAQLKEFLQKCGRLPTSEA